MSVWKLVKEGCGGFLNPPGDAEHFYSIEAYRSKASKHPESIISLRGAVDYEWVPDEVKELARQTLNDNPGNAKDELWIRSVYNYFHNGFTKDPTKRNVNDRDNVYFISEREMPLIYAVHSEENREKHLGYLYVKQWDLDHTPRMDLILRNWKETPPFKGEPWAPQSKKKTDTTEGKENENTDAKSKDD